MASHSVSSSYSIKSFFLSLLGFLFIVGLFFIPEILNFKKSAGSNKKEAAKTFQTSQKETDKSELSKISALVEGGYLKKISQDKKETVTEDKKEKAAPLVPGKPTLSWKNFREGEQRRAFTKADDQINNLYSELPGDQKDSRMALLSLSTVIKRVNSSKIEKNFTAQQALTALETAHTNVIKQFMSDGVSTLQFKRFVGINFGPLAENWSAKLSGKLIPFHPHLTLLDFQLTNRAPRGSGLNDLSLGIEGYVIGDDVTKIEVVVGGVQLDDVKIRKADKQGYRKFRVQRFDLTGKVLFKVTDRNGRVFNKLYSIYPRAKIFENERGVYSIPKSAGLQDSRLDRYFTMNSSGSSDFASEDNVLLSQGFESF